MATKTKKTDTVQKMEGGWFYVHPTSGIWTGTFLSRDAARDARKALLDAMPKAVKTPKKVKGNASPIAENLSSDSAEKVVDSKNTAPVSSLSVATNTAGTAAHIEKDTKTMASISLTKDTKARKSSSVIFTGAGLVGSMKLTKSAFPNGVAPNTLVFTIEDGVLAAPKQPKAKMTAEERKAARANAPKLSAAEKLAKLNERAAKLQARIDAEAKAAPPATA